LYKDAGCRQFGATRYGSTKTSSGGGRHAKSGGILRRGKQIRTGVKRKKHSESGAKLGAGEEEYGGTPEQKKLQVTGSMGKVETCQPGNQMPPESPEKRNSVHPNGGSHGVHAKEKKKNAAQIAKQENRQCKKKQKKLGRRNTRKQKKKRSKKGVTGDMKTHPAKEVRKGK